MSAKIIPRPEVRALGTQLREEGSRIAFANGCFDLLHVGHVRYLRAAREQGDVLVVGVNGDRAVTALKGEGRPLLPAEARAELIAALESVDYVVIFGEVRATHLLEKVRPAIYVKGGDYTLETLDAEERAVLERVGAEIKILPFEKGYSTSGLVDSLKRRST